MDRCAMGWLAVGASSLSLSAGNSAPLGASRQHAVINGVASPGINSSLHAPHGDRVELCLFDAVDAPRPSAVLVFEGEAHSSGSYRHGLLTGVEPGQLYGYRLPADPDRLLLDPYGLAVAVPDGYCRQRGQCLNGDDGWAGAMKGVAADLSRYDWAAAPPLAEPAYGVQPRSVVVLLVRVGAGDTP
jgi:isoamylase